MEQAQSRSRLESIPQPPRINSPRSALIGTRPRDHHTRTSIVVDQKALCGRHYVELTAKAEEHGAISAEETYTPAPSHLGDKALANTPAVDNSRALDEQLLSAARAGDQEAFSKLSGKYVGMVHRKALAIVRNHEDAEDIVQETMLKAYVNLHGFRGSSTFSTWLTRIAINSSLMLLRKRRSRYEVSFDQSAEEDQAWPVWELPDPRPDAEQICARRQTCDLLSHAFRRLPPRSRSMLEQYHAHDQSIQQAAKSLGITVAAAKSRLMRARQSTRSILERMRISIANVSY